MVTHVVENNYKTKKPVRISLVTDGREVNIEANGVLVAWFSALGQFWFNTAGVNGCGLATVDKRYLRVANLNNLSE